MNVQDALKVLIDRATTPEGIEVEYIAAYVERAARKAIQDGYSSGHEDALGRGPCDGSEERGMAVFVAAMMEES